jgi:cobalt-zinc-cadmium efflux system membrane fusion protein
MGAGRSGTLALVAPFAGVITDLAAAPGAFWTDTTAPLMTVSGLGTVFVTANVAEGDLAGVHRGQPVTIRFAAWPDEQVRGTVDTIGALLDPDTRRAKVRIALANPDGRYKPGMFATVTFTAPSRVAPTVPTTALVLKDDATIVYVEQQPWVFVARAVETGAEQGGRTVVTRGVAAGDRIIARGGVLLDD